MTHQNHLTNGASLEDCHTNFFALTDLCGIKWRRLGLAERPLASGEPLDDPVLSSYARCLAADILCVWRRVAAPKQEPDASANLFDLNMSVSGGSGAVTHPPLSLTAAKELWIFWYGEEPDLSGLVAPELQKSAEGSSGSWESGITYECRSLLFKALHNLIERCLLSKDVVRLGKWFVQPCSNNECGFGKSPQHLSYAFDFFVHGESTVCASMDLRIHPTVRPLTPEYLAEAAAQQQLRQQQQQQQQHGGINGGGHKSPSSPSKTHQPKSSPTSANGDSIGGSVSHDMKPKPVILAPYGLAATLTGNSYRAMDAATQKSFDDWCMFYPLCNRENAQLPAVVEVMSGGVRMRYPSKYVLTTDLDAEDYETACKVVPPLPVTEQAINALGNPATMHGAQSAANVLPERIWQDCIANPLGLLASSAAGGSVPVAYLPPSASSEAPTAAATSGGGDQTSPRIKEEPGTTPAATTAGSESCATGATTASEPWKFLDPRLKAQCSCTKCRQQPQLQPPQPSSQQQQQQQVSTNPNNPSSSRYNHHHSHGGHHHHHNHHHHHSHSTSAAGYQYLSSPVHVHSPGGPQSASSSSSSAVQPPPPAPPLPPASPSLAVLHSNALAMANKSATLASSSSVRYSPNPAVAAAAAASTLAAAAAAASAAAAAAATAAAVNNVAADGSAAYGSSSGGGGSGVVRGGREHAHRVPFHRREPVSQLSAMFALSPLHHHHHHQHHAAGQRHQHSHAPPAGSCTPGNSGIGGGGGLNTSFGRNPHSVPESLSAIPSVGSPGSAAPSPHPNSSLSQPTSVPPPDQLIPMISPIQPASVSNLQPATPHSDAGMDQKTPANTPTGADGGGDKSTSMTSPYVGMSSTANAAPASVETANAGGAGSVAASASSTLIDHLRLKSEGCGPGGGGGGPGGGGTSSNNSSSNSSTSPTASSSSSSGATPNNGSSGGGGASTSTNAASVPLSSSVLGTANAAAAAAAAVDARLNNLRLLKRPTLGSSRDSFMDEDYTPPPLLYDYSTWVAWMDHPVKRFKPAEAGTKTAASHNRLRKDLYDGHAQQMSARSAAALQASARAENAAAEDAPSASDALSPAINVKSEASAACGGDATDGGVAAGGEELLQDIKTEPVDGDYAKAGSSGGASLYTIKGLQPSILDLEQLFDEENLSGGSPSLGMVHTPPRSNKSSVGQSNDPDANLGSSHNHSGSNTTTTMILPTAKQLLQQQQHQQMQQQQRYINPCMLPNPIELTKMFPTPPSLEQHHPSNSPYDTNGGMSEHQMDTMHSPSMPMVPMIAALHDEEDVIEDWSYVFVPPTICKFVGSSKYAPLTNLPSQQHQSVSVSPISITYKPSWQIQQQQLNNNGNGSSNGISSSSTPANNNNNNSNNPNHNKALVPLGPTSKPMSSGHHTPHHHPHHTPNHLNSSQQHPHSHPPPHPLSASSSPMHHQHPMHSHNPHAHQHHTQHMHPGSVPLPPPAQMIPTGPSSIGNMLTPRPLSRPSSVHSLPGFGGPGTPHSTGGGAHNHSGMRPDMSPISPAPPYGAPSGSPMPHHQQQQLYRQRPNAALPPPPPYELAVASPANSTSSYLNKQLYAAGSIGGPLGTAGANGNTPSMHHMGGNNSAGGQLMSGNASAIGAGNHMVAVNAADAMTPEVNALLLNMLLYDTALNVFKDHNFDSCTLCVCNATKKCVGNIRGSDSGVYLALPGQSLDPAHLYNSNDPQSSSGGGGDGGGAAGSNSNSSNGFGGFGMDASPALGGNGGNGSSSNGGTSHTVGYLDEDPVNCLCGFSAVVNRRLAHRSGLFYEDEMEITGMAEDPAAYKRPSTLAMVLGGGGDDSLGKQRTGELTGNAASAIVKQEPGTTTDLDRYAGNAQEGSCDRMMSAVVMDLLKEQITLIQSSSSSIQRAIRGFQRMVTTQSRANANIHMLEYTDAQDIIALALDQSRLVFEQAIAAASGGSAVALRPFRYTFSGHRWPFIKAEGPRTNKDIVRIMNSMQPLLQDAFHKKCTTRMWDAPYTVQGPLTWRRFHRMASSSSGQCEPQPIPSVVVGHEKDWLSVSPYAIQYWDKFMLEPYSYARDVAYVVLAPDNEYVIGKTKHFFKELSTTYEMCKLGRHTPMKGWGDGVLRVGRSQQQQQQQSSGKPQATADGIDEWFATLGDSRTSDLLRLYAQTCQQQLVPYLAKIPGDKSLLDPPEGLGGSGGSSGHHQNRDRSLPSPMLPPNTPDPSASQQQQQQQQDRAPNTPKNNDPSGGDADAQQRDASGANSAAAGTGTTTPAQPTIESLGHRQDDINPPCIVIYVVDPFASGYDSAEHKRVSCLALLRCYANILATIPDSVRANINFQIISLESIMELGRSRDRVRFSDEMRCLALSVFSQCRRHLAHSANVKSLTGFGTAANMEIFLKNKDDRNRAAYRLYTPPYILSGRYEKSENTETFGTTTIEQQSSIMYCGYCLSEDQRWLLAVATDDRGELLETCTINIDIPNRRRRKKASARRLGLEKLMDFIIGVISQSGQPWRIVVGRIGRIGHGELKGWSWLLSKQNLQKLSKQLKDICEQCTLMHSHSVPSILSACLVTLEPDSNLRVMPDKFTPDERFSQTSMQSPLQTPQDVTCTHILVFPTSAVAQSSQLHFQEQHINDGLEDEILFGGLDGDDDVNMNGIEDLFGNDWDAEPIAQPSPERSRQGSPNGLDDSRRMDTGNGGGRSGFGRNGQSQDSEEVGNLLQQPLALGYMVSTAPTGRMPDWFWASCPHLENVCPVFLKTALHLHCSSVQQNNDDLLQQNQSSANDHPLDSTFTADVLRYVMEGYNVLSWLAMDSNTHDRLSCLPIHVQVLMQLYFMTAAMA